MRLRHYLQLGLICFACQLSSIASAQQQDMAETQKVAQAFLEKTVKQIGELKQVQFAPIDPRLKLKACDSISAFLPSSSKVWGKINVGVRCTGSANWQIFLPVTVNVRGHYYMLANQVKHGQSIAEADLIKVDGDLDALPANAVLRAEEIQGKTVQGNYSSGVVLRTDMLKAPLAIQQGQTVKVISHGQGFSVSTEATALTTANEGQIAKAKTNNGQVISGIAKLGAIIEIQN